MQAVQGTCRHFLLPIPQRAQQQLVSKRKRPLCGRDPCTRTAAVSLGRGGSAADRGPGLGGPMDGLKALLASKKRAVQEESGGRKAVRLSELEEARVKRWREEELAEQAGRDSTKRARTLLTAKSSLERHESEEELTREEVVRRLRLLGQPVTLFGEDDAARLARLRKAQAEFQVADDSIGGHAGNITLALQRAAEQRRKAGGGAAKARKEPEPEEAGPKAGDADAATVEETPEEAEAAATAAAFAAAAQALKDRQEEAALEPEDLIVKFMKRWTQEWGESLEARSEEVKNTSAGNQAALQHAQAEAFFKPLYRQLRQRGAHPEMVAGLTMLVRCVRERNYLQAYDIYMRLAIGNNPWPIGVTSVGIHERSAREKISHVMNGAAHIMNDEATRKYLQGIKRLITYMQRAHPTDPSRSVDFDADKQTKPNLLQAEERGETWQALGLLPAPHWHDDDGSVKVPEKWDSLLKRTDVYRDKAAELTGQKAPKTPPRGTVH